MKRIKRVLIIVVLIMMFLPINAFADDGSIWDIDQDMTYRISVDGGQAAIGEEFKYHLTISNNSKYTMSIIHINLPFDQYFDSDSIQDIPPGKSITIQGTDIVSNEVVWYKKDGEFYFDYDIGIGYSFKGMFGSEVVDMINVDDNPTPVKLTNIKDGSDFLSLNVIEENKDFVFTIMELFDEDYSDKFLNRWGDIENSVEMVNTSTKVLDNLMISGYYTTEEQPALVPGEKRTVTMGCHRQIDYWEDRPNASMVRYNALFVVDSQIYGVETERIYPNVYVDSEAKVSVSVDRYEGIFKSSEPGFDNYLVTVKNTGKETINNFYIHMPSQKQVFSREYFVNQLQPGNSTTFYLHTVAEGPFEIKLGVVANDTVYVTRKYTYNPVSGKGTLKTIGEESWSNESFSVIPEAEEQNTEPATEATPQIIYVTPEPVPTPTAQVVYITEKPAIPSWVWPLLGLAIVLAGGLVLGLRQKQSQADKGDK